MGNRELHVGIVGAGIGGVLASIAMARVGCKVTVLEAAEQLGEIGAGIQMTPNAARLLIRYGVDKVIGKNLVSMSELHLRDKQGKKVGFTAIKQVEDTLGYPWWLVHRHHLHNGLVEIARQNGVDLIINSRVSSISQSSNGNGKVEIVTKKGTRHAFDLVVGSDGVHSVVRKTLFPGIKPRPASGNCAYRAVVPFEQVRKDPITRELVEDAYGNPRKTMEVWMSPSGYIITYPISDANDYNVVLSHFRETLVDSVQEVSLSEVRNEYRDYDARIKRVVDMIEGPIFRWPLLVTGPLEFWSNAEKNVVLLGDAAHSMVNHMAQGAATSMEDGAFLARCLGHVVSGSVDLKDAIALYEQARIPKARYKQQLSHLNGWLWHLPDGPAARARNDTMKVELEGQVPIRSANLYGDPTTVLECYGYDAEEHAEQVMEEFLLHSGPIVDAATTVTKPEAARIANWFLPAEHQFQVRPRL